MLVPLVFELALPLYRLVREVVLFLLGIILSSVAILSPDNHFVVPVLNRILGIGLLSGFTSLGFLFLGQLGLWIGRRFQPFKPRSPQQWFTWWKLWFATALVVHAFFIFFENSWLSAFIIEHHGIYLAWLIVTGIGVGSTYWYAYQAIIFFLRQQSMSKHLPHSKQLTLGLLGIQTLLAVFPVVAVGIVIIELAFNPLGDPQASRFFPLHAAIKNTCLLDTTRSQCPHNLTELSYIEPKAFQELIEHNQAFYNYDAQTNQYTFIVRYSPIRAVIFDQRFLAESNVDFQEVDIQILGQDHVIHPPSFLGPIVFPDWPYLKFGYGQGSNW